MFCQSFLLPVKTNGYINIIRLIHRNHYETLNLDRSCTSKEIRTAFLSLSKQYHPDKSKEKNSHDKYVKIVEAYNVLSKPSARKEYDLGLKQGSDNEMNMNRNYRYRNYDYPNPMGGASSFGARDRMYYDQYAKTFYDKRRYPKHKSGYYGIGGIERFEKKWIVIICVLIMGFGAYIQYLAIMTTYKQLYGDRGKKFAYQTPFPDIKRTPTNEEKND